MKTFQKLIFFFAIGFSATCFAASDSPDENHYIKPSEVFLASNGMYANVDGTLFQINTLCADARGIFVPYEEMARRFVKCPACQHWYDPEKGHPNCPGYPDR